MSEQSVMWTGTFPSCSSLVACTCCPLTDLRRADLNLLALKNNVQVEVCHHVAFTHTALHISEPQAEDEREDIIAKLEAAKVSTPSAQELETLRKARYLSSLTERHRRYC